VIFTLLLFVITRFQPGLSYRNNFSKKEGQMLQRTAHKGSATATLGSHGQHALEMLAPPSPGSRAHRSHADSSVHEPGTMTERDS